MKKYFYRSILSVAVIGSSWGLAVFACDTIGTDSAVSIQRYLEVTSDLYRGGRPTESDLATIQTQNGIRTDLDLENDNSAIDSEKSAAASLNIQFIGHPMDPFATPNDQDVDQILSQLQDNQLFPIFIHCHYGEDRTGLLIGLYRVEVQGWTPATAYQEMLANGFHVSLTKLDDYFRKRTGYTGN